MLEFKVFAPGGIPIIKKDDDLVDIISKSLNQQKLLDGDIVVVTHKIVSKSEGRMIPLSQVEPSENARTIALKCGKDPRIIELFLQESSEVLWYGADGPFITRHRLGYICANAGVDQSNTDLNCAILLPKDPDASALKLRQGLEKKYNASIGVIICDTHGRTFRTGACGVAVGASGLNMLKSYIGKPDLANRIMRSSVEAQGDELAAAATLIMGQGDEGRPIAIIRGISECLGNQSAKEMVRPPENDIFLQSIKNLK